MYGRISGRHTVSPVTGTAGWSIPAADKPAFPAVGTSLQRYAATLRGVEVNSSFHRPHRRSTWERWATSVPDDFRFAAKMPKEISHRRRLIDAEEPLEQFLAEVGGFGDKLAILLLQLPPSLVFDEDAVSILLAAASCRTDAQIVCEPRHESGFLPEADTLLADPGVARVAADPAKVPAAALPGGWRGLTHLRLHGSPVMYRSPHGQERRAAYDDLIDIEARRRPPRMVHLRQHRVLGCDGRCAAANSSARSTEAALEMNTRRPSRL